MKIAIATSGRFHLLDLARELATHGHDVEFYSFIPPSRCRKFGLNRNYVKGFYLICGALEYICRENRLPYKATKIVRAFNLYLLDTIVALRLSRCDVFICASGVYVKAIKAAKKKYNATVLLERGCKHVLEQNEILCNTPGAYTQSAKEIKRELDGYQLADYVVIASEHVKQSFLKYNYPAERLFVNPYGMSLSHFHPTVKPPKDSYDVIMVGGWRYRKGCDLLAEACSQLGLRLLHVGGVVDVPLPSNHLFTHINSVQETELVHYYAQSKMMALPSREDGYGMVLNQALACGLPIVCSKETGGPDLANLLIDNKWIVIMPEITVNDLADCIQQALALYDIQAAGERNYAGNDLKELTWEAYGRRYNIFLENLQKQEQSRYNDQ